MPRTRIVSQDAGITPRSVTRRDALRMFIAAGVCATLLPGVASAETTQEKLDAAQLSYEQAQEELDRISSEYETIASQLSQTTAQIADVSAQIDEKQAQIDEKQAEIDRKQEILGNRMSASYKAGPFSTLDLLLSSATFDEFTSNIYYLDKVTESDREMIDEVRDLKTELENQRAELEQQKAELEALQEEQQAQLEEARAKQRESQELVDSLSAEVQDLMEQRDAELLAAQKLAEEMQNQGGANNVTDTPPVTGSGPLSAVINACYSTPSPGSGLCAAWVTNVFIRAGVGSFWGNADDMYYSWCHTLPSDIQPGMIIAVNCSPASPAGRIYGHIGIYIGNGTVMDNVGFVRSTSLSYWTSYYSALATPLCGWLGGIALS